MTTIPALTIWQPYASLIINGWKLYELRGHRPPGKFIGERIAIHAAARVPRMEELGEVINDPLAVCPGVTDVKVMEAQEWARSKWTASANYNSDLPRGAVLGTAMLGAPVLSANVARRGIQYKAKWAWPMLDIEKFETPIPAKGQQGFWKWER